MADETVIVRDVLGSPMEIFAFHPVTPPPHPGIVLAQHIPVGHTGVENDEFTLVTAKRLAESGYAVAVPFLFHWWDKGDDIKIKFSGARDDWMVADCQAAFNYLADHAEVDSRQIGIVGHCWGGRVGWLYACHNPQLAACAVFYGGRIKVGMGEDSIPPIELTHQINCRLLGIFGNDDQNPAPEDVDDYASALSSAGIEYEFHRFDGAGHAFQNFPTPERYRHEASEDAWKILMDFLATELKS